MPKPWAILLCLAMAGCIGQPGDYGHGPATCTLQTGPADGNPLQTTDSQMIARADTLWEQLPQDKNTSLSHRIDCPDSTFDQLDRLRDLFRQGNAAQDHVYHDDGGRAWGLVETETRLVWVPLPWLAT